MSSDENIKYIIATDGTKIMVDAEDYPLLSRHAWYINMSGEKAYATTKLRTDFGKSNSRHRIFMHHMILGGGATTDHIDADSLNNCKSNLRRATSQENGWNTKKRSRTCTGNPPTSQYKGVTKQESRRIGIHWRVTIQLTSRGERPVKKLRLGPFFSEKEAALAYNREIVKIRGQFALLNDISENCNGAAA